MNAEALIGTVLGTCTLQDLIGRGGMGAVFLAQQSRPRRQVAVKVLLPIVTLQPHQRAAFLERFRRETDAAASLEHPNIVPVHEYGERDGLAYLVMAYIGGGTLREEMVREGKLSLSQVVNYLEQMAAALDFAHDRHVIHRDIKPANILLTPDKRLLLTDFGLVKIAQENPESAENPLSEVGMPMGTPDYMAPEQVFGGEVDPRADIYSLGIVLYQMVTGVVPFKGDMPMKVAFQHVHAAPPSPRLLRPDLPAAAEQVILRALAKRPEDRYMRARDFASAFRLALESAGVQLGDIFGATSALAAINSERAAQGRRRSLFDPVWRSQLPATPVGSGHGTSPASGVASANVPSGDAPQQPRQSSNDIIAKTSMTLPSFSGLLVPTNFQPSILKPKPYMQPASDKDTPLPFAPAVEDRMATAFAPEPARTPVELATNSPQLSFAPAPEAPAYNPYYSIVSGPPSIVPAPPEPGRMEKEEDVTIVRPGRMPGKTNLLREKPDLAEPGPQAQAATVAQDFETQTTAPQAAQIEAAPAAFPVENKTRVLQDAGVPLENKTRQLSDPGTSTGLLNNQGEQRPTTGMLNDAKPRGATGALVPIQSGMTGSLMIPSGESSGQTGMLKLTQPVKVVKVPVAGQPGQYVTGLLPVLPPTPTGALNAPQDSSLQGRLKQHTKMVVLVAVVVVILLSSCIYLLARPTSAPVSGVVKLSKQQITATSVARMHVTATAQASATAQANTILSDPLSENAHNWPDSTNLNGNSYVFKNGAYHITRNDSKNLAIALLPDETVPEPFAYTLTWNEVNGNDNSTDANNVNLIGMVLRYGTIQKNGNSYPVFYSFEVNHTNSGAEYAFRIYDDSVAQDHWNQLWHTTIGNEYHLGHGTANNNTVEVIANGDHFVFIVNGKQVGDVHDGTLKSGQIGMLVNESGTEVAFSNLLLTHN